MTRLCWRLVDVLSATLEPNERDAVRGDLAEAGATGVQALRDVLGVVIRRHAALWLDWRPWLALVGGAVPAAMLLSLIARWSAEGSAIYAFLYVNNWTWGFLESPGARSDLAYTAAGFLRYYVTLACWSWTAGFVIGSVSRRTVWVNGALFGLVLFGELLAIPQHHHPFNAEVFALTFYSVVFPLLLRTVLVFLPALWGMQRGTRPAELRIFPTILWSATITLLTILAARGLRFAGMFGWWELRASWQLWLLPLAVLCPIAYMVVLASWQRWHRAAIHG